MEKPICIKCRWYREAKDFNNGIHKTEHFCHCPNIIGVSYIDDYVTGRRFVPKPKRCRELNILGECKQFEGKIV